MYETITIFKCKVDYISLLDTAYVFSWLVLRVMIMFNHGVGDHSVFCNIITEMFADAWKTCK